MCFQYYFDNFAFTNQKLYKLYMCLLLTGLVAGDNIEPDKGTEKNSKERETVKLSCSYSTSSQYVVLYWYRQYPNGEPQYLLLKGARSRYDDQTSDDRFQSTTSQTSTELTITDVRLSDSALYYCALRVGAQWCKTWDMLYKNLKLFSVWNCLLKTTIKSTIYPALNVIKYVVTPVWVWIRDNKNFQKALTMQYYILCGSFYT